MESRLATDDAIRQAARILRGGGLVAFPTETVYGLGAVATDEQAVRRIFEVKGRPAAHPLIVHLPGANLLPAWATAVPDPAAALAEALWPGPLTIVLPRSARVPDAVTGGRGTVGLRVPDQPVALRLLAEVGTGLAAPSANRFGRVSPTTADHVAADLDDDVDLILDGGPCAVGLESTIVEVTGGSPLVLRVGGVSVERLEAVLGARIAVASRGPARAPGMLAAHYAPEARVVAVEPPAAAEVVRALLSAGERVALLGTPAELASAPRGALLLDAGTDATSYARCLYQRLRDADLAGAGVVVAVLPPSAGLGRAVRDRLRRAEAAHRPGGGRPGR